MTDLKYPDFLLIHQEDSRLLEEEFFTSCPYKEKQGQEAYSIGGGLDINHTFL
jgi:hypothetical protein